jgi:hypothetical protein
MITLTATELMVAAYVGSARNVQSLIQKWSPASGAGLHDTWTPNVEGAAGEMAAAKYLGIYWQPIIGNSNADDVGFYQVRTNISRKHTDLCLRQRDNPDKIYISVLSFLPNFEILGWIFGRDGKLNKFLRDGSVDRPQCFYVPRTVLHPMCEIPKQPSLAGKGIEQ